MINQELRDTIIADVAIIVMEKYNVVLLSMELENSISSIVLSPLEIMDIVCKEFGLKTSDIIKKGRTRTNVDLKFICIHLIKRFRPNMTLKQIATYFQYKNHTSTLHAINMAETLSVTDKEFRADYIRALNKVEEFTNKI